MDAQQMQAPTEGQPTGFFQSAGVLGIASLVAGAVTCCGIGLSQSGAVVVGFSAGMRGVTDPDAIIRELTASPLAIALSMCLYASCLPALAGLGLGIFSLTRPPDRRWAGITGLVLNVLLIFGIIVIVVSGLLVML